MYRNAYLETEVLSASPVQLVEMLYRGAIDALDEAQQALDRADIAGRNCSVTRAASIVSELALSLDHDRGGKLSRDLVELYDYMQRRLNQANYEQQSAPLQEVRALLATLLDAWTSIAFGAGCGAVDGAGYASANQGSSQFGGIDLERSRVDSLG